MKEMVWERQLLCGIHHGKIGLCPSRHVTVDGTEVNALLQFEFLYLSASEATEGLNAENLPWYVLLISLRI